VPAITAALQFFRGEWAEAGVFNMEQLNPDPFLETMPSIGLDWEVQELQPGKPVINILN
jgi:carboxynorspermidine synthase